MNRTRQPLRVSAAVELASLVVLLANVCTVHLPAISSLAGPVHGCAYLFTVIAGARDPGRTRRTTALTLIPGVGGLLALRRLTAREADGVTP
ncbi:DUF3817 domain-containing protein [Streptomyces sp. H39-S7]|uniref:DUF3817 domain-containing protein n=1 Tax=Streptomyces sp. H39-S7 TaxID=3004357 RepID=UPI0022B03124|nr:DUF3817 domain-containing protein [Streptomyces sp. H39-S7]MCZ4119726.1 DUF3817 domain-containing protein [Streptomyces sp. H39-S7]